MCSLSEFVFNFLPHKDISDFHRDFFLGGGGGRYCEIFIANPINGVCN